MSGPTTHKSRQTNIAKIIGQPRDHILSHIPTDARDTGYLEIPTREVLDEIVYLLNHTKASGVSIINTGDDLFVQALENINVNVEHTSDPRSASRRFVHVYIWPADDAVISTRCPGIMLIGDRNRGAALRIIDHEDWQPFRVMAHPSVSHADCKTPNFLRPLCQQVFGTDDLWHSMQRSFIPTNDTIDMHFGKGVMIRDENATKWIVDFVDVLCRLANMPSVVGKSDKQIIKPFINCNRSMASPPNEKLQPILDACRRAWKESIEKANLAELQSYLSFWRHYENDKWVLLAKHAQFLRFAMHNACKDDDERQVLLASIIVHCAQNGIQPVSVSCLNLK